MIGSSLTSIRMEFAPFDLLGRIAPRAELVVYSALILGAGVLLAALAETWTRRLLQRAQRFSLHLSLEATLVLGRMARFIVFALAVVMMLNVWGLGLGGIWTGVLGLLAGIGVALIATWAIVSNVTGALFLEIWRPYRLGDTFEVLPEGVKGRAIDRNLMFTVLRQDDGAIVSIPNNLIFQRVVRCYPASPESEPEDTPPSPRADVE
jgi:small-conductance mechanosensitive channel